MGVMVRAVSLLWLLGYPCLGQSPPRESAPPTLEEILAYLEFDGQAREDLLTGKVVARDFREVAEKELAVSVAVLLPLPLKEVFELVRTGRTLEVDRDVTGFKDLGEGPVRIEDFAGLKLGDDEGAEVRRLLSAEPGGDLNLSVDEIGRFQAIARRFPGRTADRPQCAAAVAAECRQMLYQRCLAYQTKGLAGVAPYRREDGAEAQPAQELRSAAKSARFIGERFPQLEKSFLEYPAGGGKEFEHRFYWIKETIEDRPAFILAHRIFYPRPDGALILERQFYVGHSYNSLQIVLGCLPARGGTMLFYTNRTFTDQVAGFASGLKHSIARRQMREKIAASFAGLLAHAKAGSPQPQPPPASRSGAQAGK
jgi:hypothetical protein